MNTGAHDWANPIPIPIVGQLDYCLLGRLYWFRTLQAAR